LDSQLITCHRRTFNLVLDEDDLQRIHAVTDQSRDLFQVTGDCGDEYRRA
jgi:hypothetical protein